MATVVILIGNDIVAHSDKHDEVWRLANEASESLYNPTDWTGYCPGLPDITVRMSTPDDNLSDLPINMLRLKK